MKKAAFTPGPNFKSGYALILGRPNVGKSTLLNALLGEELAIVSPKPQTTRNRILGIHTTTEFQIIFLDTPGMVDAERGLNAFLNREVRRAMGDADVVILVVEAGEPKQAEIELLERLRQMGRPVILAINKVDKVRKIDLLPLIESYHERFGFAAIVPVSALKRDGVERIFAEAVKMLPEGPLYYPPDQLTDASERFLIGEMIREQVFLKTRQEIPYSSAVLVEEYNDEGKLLHIGASIILERDGQKGIVIGKGGEMLKSIGTAARAKIESFLGKQIFLELRVRVKKDWTRSESALREMGYSG
ncbi:MAG: GTPase Era [Myxococcales bacterium]|nr:GTPase Era [Myxococcales bacterium]